MTVVPDNVYTTIMGFTVIIIVVGALITEEAKEAGLFASLAMSMVGIWWVWVGVVTPDQEWISRLSGTVTQIAQGLLFFLFATFSILMMTEITNKKQGKRLCKSSGVPGVVIGFGLGLILFFLIVPVASGWVYLI